MFGGWFGGSSTAEVEQIVRRLEETRIERELALREAIVERKNAYKIAMARERLKWTATAGFLTAGMSLGAAFYHKNVFYATPVIPLVSVVAYEAHQAVGAKIQIVIQEAESILRDTRLKLSLKSVSIKEIDARVNEIICSPDPLD
ncbi:Plasminogen receptor [Aphelenchoides fujianensis]|nr:Plasminogen receptor [Aphelenchoides fujianensis]